MAHEHKILIRNSHFFLFDEHFPVIDSNYVGASPHSIHRGNGSGFAHGLAFILSAEAMLH